MHEHQRYIDLISAVLDGEAAPAEAAELMDHLSACPACQAAYEQTLALRDAFLGWEEPEPPGDLAAAVMSRVRQEPRRAPGGGLSPCTSGALPRRRPVWP